MVTINVCSFSHSNLQCPDDIVSKHLVFDQDDFEGTVILAFTIWPILLAFNLVTFLDVGYHDNSWGSLLPNQSPKSTSMQLLGPTGL